MSLLVPPPASYTPCPAGLHQGVCCDVVDLGLKETTFGIKHKIRLTWQLVLVNPDTGHRFDCIRSYTRSLDRRARLRTDLESWFGRALNDAELRQGVDLERLLGVNAFLNVTHKATADGRTYANVNTILPPPAGTPAIAIVGYIRLKDRPASSTTPLPTPVAPGVTMTSAGASPVPPAVSAVTPTPISLTTPTTAEPEPDLDSDQDDISFAFGANVGAVVPTLAAAPVAATSDPDETAF